MLVHDPSLAEAPGFTTEQLESLTRSVEQKKQRLEADIDAYIKKKQRELAHYEQEVTCRRAQTQPLIALTRLAPSTLPPNGTQRGSRIRRRAACGGAEPNSAFRCHLPSCAICWVPARVKEAGGKDQADQAYPRAQAGEGAVWPCHSNLFASAGRW